MSKNKMNTKSDKTNKHGNGKNVNKNQSANKERNRPTKDRSDTLNNQERKTTEHTNDSSWYSKNPTLLRNVASIPYSWATGLPLNPKNESPFHPYAIPGVMAAVLDMNPLSIGGPSDPVNVAARMIVGKIRSENSGAKNYDPNDLMIRLLAEGSIIAYFTYATRVFATGLLYSSQNRYWPDALLTAQSMDPQDVRKNMNHFKARINELAAKARKIMYIPAGMDLYKRYSWVFANYFADSENEKDQNYLMTPSGYYVYNFIGKHAGSLDFKPWDSHLWSQPLHTVDELCDAIQEMLEPIYEDQEFCIMQGDMYKFYGESALQIGDLSDLMIAKPVVDHVVLDQIRNAQTLPNTRVTSEEAEIARRCITQDPDVFYLIGNTSFKQYPETVSYGSTNYDSSAMRTQLNLVFGADYIVDTPIADPTPDDTMENTRLTAMINRTFIDEDNDYAYTVTCGSERVELFKLFTMTPTPDHPETPALRFWTHRSLIIACDNQGTAHALVGSGSFNPFFPVWTTGECLQFFIAAKAFDYYPKTYFMSVERGNKEGDVYPLNYYPHGIVTRWTNYALIPSDMLTKVNNCAFNSLIGIFGGGI